MEIVISGYGKMGRMVEKVLEKQSIACVAKSESICDIDPEIAHRAVCIDFTTPDAFRANYKFLAENFKAVVVGTTGWNDIKDEVIECFKANGTTMIYGSNFSVGVNIFFAAVDYVTKLMHKTGGYSPYVTEMHHCHKLDAPSGTAKSLASIVDNNLNTKADVSSVRCGEIPGIHTVGFEGLNDRITFTHEAFSREGFAAGAVEAAKMTENLQGVFEFKDIIFND